MCSVQKTFSFQPIVSPELNPCLLIESSHRAVAAAGGGACLVARGLHPSTHPDWLPVVVLDGCVVSSPGAHARRGGGVGGHNEGPANHWRRPRPRRLIGTSASPVGSRPCRAPALLPGT